VERPAPTLERDRPVSKVYERYRVPGEPDAWYLKLSDGSIYGPEEHPVIYRWASEGRIAPGDQMSQDKITWLFAENVARLRMDWVAEMDNGRSYGPFNLLAVPNLVRHGTISQNARLANKYTGKSILVEEVLKPDVAAELAVQNDLITIQDNAPNIAGPVPPVQEQPKQHEHHKDRHRHHTKGADPDHHVEELQKRAMAAETELSQIKKQLDDQQKKYHELESSTKAKLEHVEKEKVDHHRKKIADADQRIEELQKRAESAAAEVTGLKTRLEDQQKKHHEQETSERHQRESLEKEKQAA